MKKQILSLSLILTSIIVSAQNVTIPDANFKAALLSHNPAVDTGGDGEISLIEAQSFSGTLYLGGKSIADLTGIEAFVSITGLLCNNNQLTSLDLSSNSSLTGIWCNNNQLVSLNVKNGNNFMIANATFYANDNPNLTCIEVDNAAQSTTNWTNIDAQTSFSEYCSSLGNGEQLFENPIVIYPNPTKDKFTVEIDTPSPVSIYNLLGEIVVTTNLHAGKNTIDMSNFPSGIYFLQLRDTNGKITSMKIVKH